MYVTGCRYLVPITCTSQKKAKKSEQGKIAEAPLMCVGVFNVFASHPFGCFIALSVELHLVPWNALLGVMCKKHSF